MTDPQPADDRRAPDQLPRTDGGTATGADETTLDPWGSSTVADYRKLFEEFGIEEFDDVLSAVPSPHYLMRRGVIFGHRGYDRVARAMANDEEFAVLSGWMPTGDPHIGHKLVIDEIVWHQQQGGDAYALIADMEAHSARGLSWDEIARHSREYLLSLIALGFDPEEGEIYRQSDNRPLQDLAFELGAHVNFSEMQALYGFDGETNVSHMQSVVTQMADILYPQIDEPKPTVIPVGPDQDPHVRLSRDLAASMRYFKVSEAYASFETGSQEEQLLLEWVYENLAESAHSQELDAEIIRCDLAAELLSEYREVHPNFEGEAPHGANAELSEEGADGLFVKEAFHDETGNIQLPNPSIENVFDDVFAVEGFPYERISTETYDELIGKLQNSGKEPLRPRRRLFNREGTEEAFEALIEAVEGEKRVYEGHIDSFELSREDAESLAREVELDHGGYGFVAPSSIYHRFMTGLTGGKMSSSVPASHISLLDDPEEGYEKVKSATTGGRETAEKQRELGGRADECPVYELYNYLLAADDDEFAIRVYEECTNGERLCGGCKEQAAELMREFLADHQEKREEAKELLDDLDIDLDP